MGIPEGTVSNAPLAGAAHSEAEAGEVWELKNKTTC